MITIENIKELASIADMLDGIGAKKEASVIDKFIQKIASGEIAIVADQSDVKEAE